MVQSISPIKGFNARSTKTVAFVVLVTLLFAVLGYYLATRSGNSDMQTTETTPTVDRGTIKLTKEQAKNIELADVQEYSFEQKREAGGIIDFNQDLTVQVFPPYQGRIGKVFVKAGDNVQSGQVLYTMLVPDLAQAGSLLISTSGALKNANDVLSRAKTLYDSQSISLKELQQNTSDQQGADAAYRAALKTVALFGLPNQEIKQIEKEHKVDTEMPIRSPLAGRVTARAAVQGQLVQPGAGLAPVSVSNMQKLWMIASVPESELAAYRIGQLVGVSVQAYPQTVFKGQIIYIGDVADSTTHRIALRAEIADPKHQLRPQMLASFRITLGDPDVSPGVPVNALAREGDGSNSAWVSNDGVLFERRSVVLGNVQDGIVQITKGLSKGEKVASNKALFLSNLYSIATN